MKHLLMQSLPNSGSTWFASLLARHIPGCRYFNKEFFNPVCNIKHEMTLRRRFGCELVECYRNIALPGDERIDDDIRKTWGVEDFTFTKECNSAFKLPVWVRHFNCFVLLRKPEHTFPPGRVRVWSFYEHAWFALREAGHAVAAISTEDRALEAHGILTEVVRHDAARLDVPIIEYAQVFVDPRGIVEQLREVVEIDDRMVDDIIATAWDRTRREMVPT